MASIRFIAAAKTLGAIPSNTGVTLQSVILPLSCPNITNIRPTLTNFRHYPSISAVQKTDLELEPFPVHPDTRLTECFTERNELINNNSEYLVFGEWYNEYRRYNVAIGNSMNNAKVSLTEDMLARLDEAVLRSTVYNHSDNEIICKGDEEVKKDQGVPNNNNKPNADKLHNAKTFLITEIPNIMHSRHEYRMYTHDVILENNWDITKPFTTVGVKAYAVELLKVRWYMHCKYAKVRVNVTSASIDEVSGSVTIRWRLAGLPQIKAFLSFWKFVPFRVTQKALEESEWLDGLSTFYVNATGSIYKVKLDRVTPDEGPIKNVGEIKLAEKLGLQGTT